MCLITVGAGSRALPFRIRAGGLTYTADAGFTARADGTGNRITHGVGLPSIMAAGSARRIAVGSGFQIILGARAGSHGVVERITAVGLLYLLAPAFVPASVSAISITMLGSASALG